MNLPLVILASKSPRRRQILSEAGFEVTILTKETEENYPETLELIKVPAYLAEKKAAVFKEESWNNLVIAADTLVLLDGKVLGKPVDSADAIKMIQSLSGKKHEVITGVTILYKEKFTTFSDTTEVYFRDLTDDEISYYVEKFKPLDKAGAYGIQEWIGMIGISKIVGSYYNVMGFPIEKAYREILALKEG